MRAPPSAAQLLSAWERGHERPPAERPLALLALARPDVSAARLAELPLGRRDAELLALRRLLFGAAVAAVVPCPGCGDRLEVALDLADLELPSAPDSAGALALERAGHRVTFRLPTTADLVALADASPEAAWAGLLERCVVEARAGDMPVSAAALPAPLIAEVERRMAEADPQADLEVALACPACGRGWIERFDVAAFLWEELDGWARALLDDVATLARSYGWSEPDILAMSAPRRRAYLDLAGA